MTLHAPDRLQPPQVRQRVVVGVHRRLEVGLRAVEDAARRIQPRTQLQARANHLGVREHHLEIVRRIVQRRDAEREVGQERPRRARGNAVALGADVRVRVDEARDDRLAADVDAARAGRDR